MTNGVRSVLGMQPGTLLLVFVALACAACGGETSSAPDASPDSASDALVVTDDDGGPFTCGNTAVCDGRTQVCEHIQGGPAPGVDYYACSPIPSACYGDVSCACVSTALRGRGATACSATGSDLTVNIDVP